MEKEDQRLVEVAVKVGRKWADEVTTLNAVAEAAREVHEGTTPIASMVKLGEALSKLDKGTE